MEYYKFEDSLGRLSREISRDLGLLLENKFRNNGLEIRLSEWLILTYIFNKKISSQKELVEATGRNKVAVKRLIDILEKKNLVYRVTGAEDHRYNKVYLTSQGESTYKKLSQIAAGALSKAKNNIPGAEIESCIRVLHKVSENLQRNIKYLRQPKI